MYYKWNDLKYNRLYSDEEYLEAKEMKKLEELELKMIEKEMEEWNHPDQVAYRNRNGCEFEREEPQPYSFYDLKHDLYNE